MQKYELRHVKAKVLELFTKALGQEKRSKKKKRMKERKNWPSVAKTHEWS